MSPSIAAPRRITDGGKGQKSQRLSAGSPLGRPLHKAKTSLNSLKICVLQQLLFHFHGKDSLLSSLSQIK